MFRGRVFRGNSGPAQNMASRLDETQNFASRLDETTGFDRYVPNLREGCLRHDWPSGGDSERMDRFSIILMSETLMPETCLGKNLDFGTNEASHTAMTT